MSNRMVRVVLLSSSALVSFCCLGGMAVAQAPGTQPSTASPPTPPAQPQAAPGTLPTITVETTRKKPAKKQAERRPLQPVQRTGVTRQATAQRQRTNPLPRERAAREGGASGTDGVTM